MKIKKNILFSAGTPFPLIPSPFKIAFCQHCYKLYQKIFNALTELGFSLLSLSKGLPMCFHFMLEILLALT